MRVIELCNLNRNDHEYQIVRWWIDNNVECLSVLEVGDNQKDALNGSLYYQFDNTEDAMRFVMFLYEKFSELVLFVNISRNKMNEAAKNTSRKSPYSFRLYDAQVCYDKADYPSCKYIMANNPRC